MTCKPPCSVAPADDEGDDDKREVNPAALPTRDQRAHDLVPAVYDQLRRLANVLLNRMSPGETMRATELVNEVYIRLLKNGDPGWANEPHIKGAFVIAMRRELIDRARKRDRRIKAVGFDPDLLGLEVTDPGAWLLEIDTALRVMENTPGLERQAEVVLLKFYGGMTVQQIADLIDTSIRTVERDWLFAKRWLQSRLGQDG